MKNRKTMCELLERIPGYCAGVPCEKCRLRRIADYGDSVPVNRFHVYRGYILQQYSDGDYCIFKRRTKKCLLHADCTRILTRREAREHISFYIEQLRDKRKNYRKR